MQRGHSHALVSMCFDEDMSDDVELMRTEQNKRKRKLRELHLYVSGNRCKHRTLIRNAAL